MYIALGSLFKSRVFWGSALGTFLAAKTRSKQKRRMKFLQRESWRGRGRRRGRLL